MTLLIAIKLQLWLPIQCIDPSLWKQLYDPSKIHASYIHSQIQYASVLIENQYAILTHCSKGAKRPLVGLTY